MYEMWKQLSYKQRLYLLSNTMGSRKDVSVVNQGTTTKLTAAVEESNDPGPFVQFCIVTANDTLLILISAFVSLKIYKFPYNLRRSCLSLWSTWKQCTYVNITWGPFFLPQDPWTTGWGWVVGLLGSVGYIGGHVCK